MKRQKRKLEYFLLSLVFHPQKMNFDKKYFKKIFEHYTVLRKNEN